MIKNIYTMLLALFILSCTATLSKRNSVEKNILDATLFKQSFVGFSLYDIKEKKYLIEFNDRKYFTPASNTKLFTYFFAKKILEDSTTSLRYKSVKDSLIIWGCGDPSLLHHDFKNAKVITFLKKQKKKIYLSFSNLHQKHFGLGWAWDDYSDAFSAELSPFPIYGNVLKTKTNSKQETIQVYPIEFTKKFKRNASLRAKSFDVRRVLRKNEFNYKAVYPFKNDSIEVPFITSESLLLNLLENKIEKRIMLCSYSNLENSKILYTFQSETLYKRMLQFSDNFLAEQCLMMISNKLFSVFDITKTIQYAKDSLLSFISDPPRWVDGSGLSRYNLFTPRSFVEILRELYEMIDKKVLFSSLAIGGKMGTLKSRFISKDPFIYGKTGTLSNNHNLSAFLIGKSGKVYIFSFMMNHYRNPTFEMKKQMDKIIFRLRNEL